MKNAWARNGCCCWSAGVWGAGWVYGWGNWTGLDWMGLVGMIDRLMDGVGWFG